jgi:hypothetical protein
MARIKGGSLGVPSGKVGNTVYKHKNKKTIAYLLNEAYNKSYSEAALKMKRFSHVFLNSVTL